MAINENLPRRAVLVAGLGGAGALALAACSGGSDASTAKSAAGSSGDGRNDAPARTSGAADATSEPAAEGSKASGAGPLASLDDLTVGKAVAVDLAGGKPGLLTKTGANSVVCFSAVCTHEGCTVKPAGAELDCPCHGSKYNAKTGAVLGGPAPAPLPPVRVKVAGGKVVEA